MAWNLNRILIFQLIFVHAVAQWLDHATDDWGRLETLAISFTLVCQCLLEETLKAVGPFYLVSMPWEVKDNDPINVYLLWNTYCTWSKMSTRR